MEKLNVFPDPLDLGWYLALARRTLEESLGLAEPGALSGPESGIGEGRTPKDQSLPGRAARPPSPAPDQPHHRPSPPLGKPLLAWAEQPPWPGVFVTLWKNNHQQPGDGQVLRGCIGHIEGRMPLSKSVPLLAREAAFHDPRFPPLEAGEFGKVRLEITVLSPPVPVAGWQDIRLGVHGMVLECSGRQAVFLPQVATEQGWNLDQTLTALSRKAGLPPGAWKTPQAKFRVFEGRHQGEPHAPEAGDAPGSLSHGA